MYLKCICGHVMNDIASPNDVDHVLLSDRARENVQDLVDRACAEEGEIDLWPEYWETAGAVVVWKCSQCARLYLNARSALADVVVYQVERMGLTPD